MTHIAHILHKGQKHKLVPVISQSLGVVPRTRGYICANWSCKTSHLPGTIICILIKYMFFLINISTSSLIFCTWVAGHPYDFTDLPFAFQHSAYPLSQVEATQKQNGILKARSDDVLKMSQL